MSLREEIYKGCTVPSMLFGVPLLPFILATLVAALLGLYAFLIFGMPGLVFLGILYGYLLMWARKVSKHDDTRLLQLLLKLQIRGPQAVSKMWFGAVSFGPHQKSGDKQ